MSKFIFRVVGGKHKHYGGINWKYVSEPYSTLEAALHDLATCGYPVTQLDVLRDGKRIHCLQEAKS